MFEDQNIAFLRKVKKKTTQFVLQNDAAELKFKFGEKVFI